MCPVLSASLLRYFSIHLVECLNIFHFHCDHCSDYIMIVDIISFICMITIKYQRFAAFIAAVAKLSLLLSSFYCAITIVFLWKSLCRCSQYHCYCCANVEFADAIAMMLYN